MAKKRAAKKGVSRRNTPRIEPPEEGSWIVEALRPLAVPIDDVQLDPKNSRKHGEKDLAAIAASLAKYGQRVPIVVNRTTGLIEKGNGTYRAATDRLGWSTIAVVYVDDDARTATGFALTDNRTAELSEYDQSRLAEQIAMLQCDDEDFAELLDLDDLLPKDATDDDGEAVAIPLVFGVSVDCKSQAVQTLVHQLLVDHQAEFPEAEIKLQTE